MAGGTQIPVQVGYNNSSVIIKPDGDCTVAICPTIRHFLQQISAAGTVEVCFDLSQVPSMDSTFIGLMLAMAEGRRDSSLPRVALAAPSAGALMNLERMFVKQMFRLIDQPTGDAIEWKELPADQSDGAEVADLVIEAHENLIQADERNRATFGGVVEAFKAERDQKNQGNTTD